MLSSCHRKSLKTASGSRVTSRTKTPSHPHSKRRISEYRLSLPLWFGNINYYVSCLFFLKDTTEASWKPPISGHRKAHRYDLEFLCSPMHALIVGEDPRIHWLLPPRQRKSHFTLPMSPPAAWSCTGATQSPSCLSTLRWPWRACVTMLWYWRPTCPARNWWWASWTALRRITLWSLPAPKTAKLSPPVKASWPPVSP